MGTFANNVKIGKRGEMALHHYQLAYERIIWERTALTNYRCIYLHATRNVKLRLFN